MATFVPAKRATQFIFYGGVASQANSKILQVNPTIAAGDFKVSIDGGATANLATLPVVTPAGGKSIKFTLSAAEMTGDNIQIIGSDVAGAEWCDFLNNIQTSSRQVDDLAFPNVSGRGQDVSSTGEVESNLVQIDGLATNGNNASLFLKTLDIRNNAGNAMTLSVTAGNGDGLYVQGLGSGSGLNLTAGSTGNGLRAAGGSTSGEAIFAFAQGTNQRGVKFQGIGTGSGFNVAGGANAEGFRAEGGAISGDGAKFVGSSSSGNGISTETTNGDGLHLFPTNGHGISAKGQGSNKHGFISEGGTSGISDGIKGLAGVGGKDIRGTLTGPLEALSANSIDSNALATSATDEIRDAVFAQIIEGTFSFLQYTRLMGSPLLGQLSGAATPTNTIRDTANIKNRVIASVDALGNRTSVTYDAS